MEKAKKNKCNKLCRKEKQNDLKNITENDFNKNKTFSNFVQLFLTNKELLALTFISITKGNQFIVNEEELVEIF